MVVRPFVLSDLSIPATQPSHADVVKLPSPPALGSRSAGSTGATVTQENIQLQPAPLQRLARERSTSHLQRLRDLRATQCATPSLSPLNIASPKISKLPRPAAGGGRAYAAYLKAWAKQAELSSQGGMRIVRSGTATGGSGHASRTSTPGHALRARPNLHRGTGGAATRPLQPSRLQRPHSHAAARRRGVMQAVVAGGAR